MPNDPMIAELLDDLASQAATARLASSVAGKALADDLDALIAAHRSGARFAVETDASSRALPSAAAPATGSDVPVGTSATTHAATGEDDEDDYEDDEPSPLALVFTLSVDAPATLSEGSAASALAELAPTLDAGYGGVSYGKLERVDDRTIRVEGVANDGYAVPGTVAFSGTVGETGAIAVTAVVPPDPTIEADGEGSFGIAGRAAALGGPEGLDLAGTMELANAVAAEMGVDGAEAGLALVVSYRREDGERLEGADLSRVAARGLASLSAFGSLIETKREAGDDESRITYEPIVPGALSLAAIAAQAAAWRGVLPFAGIGAVSASAEAVPLA